MSEVKRSLLDPEYFIEAFWEELAKLMEENKPKAQEECKGEGDQRAQEDILELGIKAVTREVQSELEEGAPEHTPLPIIKRKMKIKRLGGMVRELDVEIGDEEKPRLPAKMKKEPFFLKTIQLYYNQIYLCLENSSPPFLKVQMDYKRRKIFKEVGFKMD